MNNFQPYLLTYIANCRMQVNWLGISEYFIISFSMCISVYIHVLVTCCSHDLEATDILPIIIDGLSDNIRCTAVTPRLPFCSMACKTTATVWNQYIPRTGPSVTLGRTAGWILHWRCHGEHYN